MTLTIDRCRPLAMNSMCTPSLMVLAETDQSVSRLQGLTMFSV